MSSERRLSSGRPGSSVQQARVALTQSLGRLEELRQLLEANGCEVVRKPLVETVPRLDEKTRAAVTSLMALPWLLLTSRSTVEALQSLGASFGSTQLGAIGPATAQAAKAAGGNVALIAAPNNAEGLAYSFLAHPQARGPVGLPKGNRALRTLEQELGRAGIATRPLVVYDTVSRPWDEDQGWSGPSPSEDWDSFANDGHAGVDVIVLASPTAVAALPDWVGRGCGLVTLGETTSQAVRGRGWSCEVAAAPTPTAALEAVERVLERREVHR